MHEKTNLAVTELTGFLKEVFADNLLAVVLYGSSAGNGNSNGTGNAYNAAVSDINVLVILKESSGGADSDGAFGSGIFKFGRLAKTLIRKNRISPIIMTQEEFSTAGDVFPLEYSDILEEHIVIYGSKEILNVEVSKKNLRLQLEEKLRGSVADIRTMLTVSGGDEKLLQRFILQWSSLGAVLLRGLLRLKGKNAAGITSQLLFSLVETQYNVSLEGFSMLNSLRENKKSRPFTALTVTEKLLEPLVSLVKTIDSMDEKNL